jgi:hypothetical protein
MSVSGWRSARLERRETHKEHAAVQAIVQAGVVADEGHRHAAVLRGAGFDEQVVLAAQDPVFALSPAWRYMDALGQIGLELLDRDALVPQPVAVREVNMGRQQRLAADHRLDLLGDPPVTWRCGGSAGGTAGHGRAHQRSESMNRS